MGSFNSGNGTFLQIIAIHRSATRCPRLAAKLSNERRRDKDQAHLVARIAVRHLGLRFDDSALSALPLKFQTLTTELDLANAEIAPDWS